MDFVTTTVLQTVISKLVESMIPSLIPRGIFGDNIIKEIKQWKILLDEFRSVLQDAEDRKIHSGIGDWLQDLKNVTFDIEDVIEAFNNDDLKHQVEGAPSTFKKICEFPSKIMKKRKRGEESNTITNMLQSLKERKESYNLLCSPIRASAKVGVSRPSSSSLAGNEGVVFGRGEDKRSILALLKQQHDGVFGVLPIIGMGGLGKTTLARHVYNNNELINCFDLKVWVCVSADYDICRITKQILQAVSPNCNADGKDLNWLQVELSKMLKGKKFLIVLDDLWNEKYEDWKDLRAPFYDGFPGSRIIITTRSQIVAQKVGTMEHILPEVLSDHDCHLLLCEHAGLDTHKTSVYGDMAKKIAKKCSGLPLAAVSVGGILRNTKELEVWEEILNNKAWMSKDEHIDVMALLKMSYNFLSPQLKSCFACFAMLPEDYDFCEFEIELLWIGTGAFDSMSGGKSKKEVAKDCFNQLLSRSMFSYDPSPCKEYIMHDLVREVAVEVLGRNSFIGIGDELPESFQSTRHFIFKTSRFDKVIDAIVEGKRSYFTFANINPLTLLVWRLLG